MLFSFEELDAVRAPLVSARPLPAHAYADPLVFELDRRAIIDKSWRCVGVLSDLERPGSWSRTPLADRSVVVVRGEDFQLRAFYDACLHRGAPIFEGDRGHSLRPTCGYHGWSYDTLGALRLAPGAPRSLDRSRCALRQVRVETAFELVFACLDAQSPTLMQAMGEPPPWLAGARLQQSRVVHRARWRVGANWKLLVENFQESHHFARVHPMLQARTPSEHARSWRGSGAWSGGIMPIRSGDATVTLGNEGARRPLLCAEDDAGQVHDALLFPLLLTSLQPDYLLIYRLDPTGPGETFIDHELLVHAASEGTQRDVIDLWARVHDEDRRVCESQQTSMNAGAWEPLCYCESEDGVHDFDRRVAEIYAAELARHDDRRGASR